MTNYTNNFIINFKIAGNRNASNNEEIVVKIRHIISKKRYFFMNFLISRVLLFLNDLINFIVNVT